MQTVELVCAECGEILHMGESFCETCNIPVAGRGGLGGNGYISEFFDTTSDAEYYENVEFYEGELPVPDRVREEWFDSEITNIIFKVPLTLNTLVDAQGRTSLDCHVQKIIGVKMKDIAYSMSLEDTLFFQKNNPDVSGNTVVVEVEGILTYNKTGVNVWES